MKALMPFNTHNRKFTTGDTVEPQYFINAPMSMAEYEKRGFIGDLPKAIEAAMTETDPIPDTEESVAIGNGKKKNK